LLDVRPVIIASNIDKTVQQHSIDPSIGLFQGEHLTAPMLETREFRKRSINHASWPPAIPVLKSALTESRIFQWLKVSQGLASSGSLPRF